MKFIYLIPLLFNIYFVYCTELGGVKFAITEKMAYEVLNHFYYKINSQIQKMTIEDIHVETGVNIREIEFGIPNFTQDKVKIKFKENGININISGLKAWLSCTLYVSNLIIPFHNNIKVDIKNAINLAFMQSITSMIFLPLFRFLDNPFISYIEASVILK